MRKSALIAVGALAIATAPALADSRTYDFDSFHAIDIATGLKAVITKDDTQSVRAETESGNLDYLSIEVKDGELHAGLHKDLIDIILSGGLLNMLNDHNEITLYITALTLDAISASSGASVDSSFLTGPVADIDISSGANVEVKQADIAKLTVDTSSGAKARLSGSCDSIDMDFSSGSHIRAEDLSCINVRVDGSSGASADITANGYITGSMSSGASLHLVGNPDRIDVESSSGGSVTIR